MPGLCDGGACAGLADSATGGLDGRGVTRLGRRDLPVLQSAETPHVTPQETPMSNDSSRLCRGDEPG